MIKVDFSLSHGIDHIRGHVNPFWTKEDYVNLPYVKQETTIKEEVDQWVDMGYPRETSFTGCMYSSKNPMPSFVDGFKTMFSNLENMTFTLYRMQTMDVMPVHVDHFSTYKNLFNADRDRVIRILVMLEDWKPGHYLEIDGKGITDWQAGDYFIWKNHVPHAASNIGKIDDLRYTLQITATLADDVTHFHESNRLYEFNVPERSWIEDTTLIKRIRKVLGDNNGLPYIIYTGNESIKTLEEIRYPENVIEQLNTFGIDIYLYEPICSYIEGQEPHASKATKHTEWFYSEFGDADHQRLRADELDSILKFKRNNNLDTVRVHTCDYDIEKYYTFYNKDLYLMCDDVCLKTRWYKNILDKDFLNQDLNKKFISLNYRYTFHRQLVAAYLANKDSTLSWPFECGYQHMDKSIWYDLSKDTWDQYRETLRKGVDTLNENSPYNLDFTFNKSTKLNDRYFKPRFPEHQHITSIDWYAIEKFYKGVFCEVVNETRYAQPTANFSEKVHLPMMYFKPFILVAPPYTLKYIKEQGFKTFSEFWDEGYDEIQDHEQRLIAIFKIIDYIDNLSYNELGEMYQKMMPILTYNQKLLKMTLRP